MQYITIIVVILLVTLSGLFSGLTLGLMGLNKFELKRRVKLGNKEAEKIYPVRKMGNLLLTTLLLGNVAVNATLAIFLGDLAFFSGVTAMILSTALIVTFGEILPQAVFSRFALRLGAKTVWIVWIFLILFYPLAKPLAWGLDKLLGGELPRYFSKKELRLIFQELRDAETSDLDSDEFEILKGGLDFSNKLVWEVMTPKDNVFAIEEHTPLTREVLLEIQKQGHSRIPVYHRVKEKIVGILYSKDMVAVDPESNLLASALMRRNVQYILRTDRLDNVLNLFRKKRMHIFIVRRRSGAMEGIITLEDVLEEIVGEIVDEYDIIIDMRKAERRANL